MGNARVVIFQQNHLNFGAASVTCIEFTLRASHWRQASRLIHQSLKCAPNQMTNHLHVVPSQFIFIISAPRHNGLSCYTYNQSLGSLITKTLHTTYTSLHYSFATAPASTLVHWSAPRITQRYKRNKSSSLCSHCITLILRGINIHASWSTLLHIIVMQRLRLLQAIWLDK